MTPRDIERIEQAKAEQARQYATQTHSVAECGPQCGAGPSLAKAVRERTSREVLEERLCQMSQDYEDLSDLLKALPQELPYRADRALRKLLLNQKG